MKASVHTFMVAPAFLCANNHVMFAMTQYELFGMFGAADLDDLSRGVELGKQMPRKYVSRLEALSLVAKMPRRPLQFSLPNDVEGFLGMRDFAR